VTALWPRVTGGAGPRPESVCFQETGRVLLRRGAPGLVGLLLLAAGLGCGGVGDRPDVLLVTIDTLRADHLKIYGFAHETSPSIDELARQGVTFERAVAAAPATAPSHASIMTSRYTRRHSIGFRNGATKLSTEGTLAELLRDAGYRTAAFVSNMVLQRRVGLDKGFDVYDDALTTSETNRKYILERRAPDTTDRALAWLSEQGREPVFLWVHYQDPHGPYTPPSELVGRFPMPNDGGGELPLLSDDSGKSGIPAYQAIEGLRHLHEYRSRYASEIRAVDDQLGRLLRAIEARAAERGSVVLLTADHGESFGERDRYLVHFYTTTPENAHVPMIVRARGLPPSRRTDPVHHVDVMPTLLELAGVEVPNDVDGLALGPLLRSGASLPERLLYCDAGHETSVYRGDRITRMGGPPSPGRTRSAQAWASYAWRSEGSFERIDLAIEDLEPLRQYAGSRVEGVAAPSLSDEDIERLRALGYGEAASP